MVSTYVQLAASTEFSTRHALNAFLPVPLALSHSQKSLRRAIHSGQRGHAPQRHFIGGPRIRFKKEASHGFRVSSNFNAEQHDITTEGAQMGTKWQLASWLLGRKYPVPAMFISTAAAVSGGLLGSGFDMQGPTSTAEALLVLAVIVTVHECGHFLAARLQNIHVSQFAIGFGPSIFTYKGAEVEYSLRAIPLGGYVGFPDNDPNNGFPEDDPDLLKNRGVRDRAIVICAGVIANIVFAFLILLTQVTTVGVAQLNLRPGVRIPDVVIGSVAERAGLRTGDIILSINGQSIPPIYAAVPAVVQEIRESPGKTLNLAVERGEERFNLSVVPSTAADGGGRIGVQLATNGVVAYNVAKNPFTAVSLAGREFNKLLGNVTGGLRQLIFNFNEVKDAISGPVAIVAVGAEVARNDISGLFQFAAIVNINLAVVNALPLPALDGGYLALLLVEAARGKKLPDGVESGIMASGFILLMAAGLLLIIRDTLTLTGLG
eukprot:jgi/Botrbrau1/771/Bobra.0181s0025.1